MARLLCVDDEPELLDGMRRALVAQGYEVKTAGSGGEAVVALETEHFDVVVVDTTLPEGGGLAILRAARAWGVPAVVLAEDATLDGAVAAVRAGARDYLAKPASAARIARAVADALATDTTRKKALAPPELVAASPPMKRISEMIGRVGPTDLTVLITGESGTGKEVVARAIHAASTRSRAAFVAVDCAAIPANLMESELFGHERGAFTGANTTRRGLAEEADGGTFFLDEIAELEPHVQTKLLRLLQDHGFRRVGGNRPLTANLRVIAATNRDLDVEVAAGRFRLDLFHRLNVVRMMLPPLRERPEDVVPLLEHVLARVCATSGRRLLSLLPEAQERLCAWSWPGNVRELVNCARYLAGLTRGDVAGIADLPPGLRADPVASEGPPLDVIAPTVPYKEAKRAWTEWFDDRYVARVLEATGGNVSAAARTSGIDRKSLQRLLHRADRGEPEGG